MGVSVDDSFGRQVSLAEAGIEDHSPIMSFSSVFAEIGSPVYNVFPWEASEFVNTRLRLCLALFLNPAL